MNETTSLGNLPSFEEIEEGLSVSVSDFPKSPILSEKEPDLYLEEENRIESDYDYMKSASPSIVQKISGLIEEECDRMEYQGSFLYEERPDKTTLYKITDRITSHLPPVSIRQEDLILALLCDEIFHRRLRYYRKQHFFH